jgi:hypothetical protein
MPKPGSGIKRGWCPDCKGTLCGAERCMKACVPYEAWLEIKEGAKVRDEYLRNYLKSGQEIPFSK